MADALSLEMVSRQPKAAPPPASSVAPAAPLAPAPAKDLFHELLSDLNPLQYIPVVGTLYRAITGDQGSPTLRFAASLATSFALAGPIGVAITAAEKLTGIDPERMVLDAATHLFHLGHSEAPPSWSPEPTGTALAFAQIPRDISADDLNELELQRLRA